MTEKKTEKRRFDMDIRFKVNSDEFDFTQPQTAKNLENLKEYINQSCEDLRVVLEGHASGEGSAAHNKRLSELRARRIQRWLEEEGVQKNRNPRYFGLWCYPSPCARTPATRTMALFARTVRRIS